MFCNVLVFLLIVKADFCFALSCTRCECSVSLAIWEICDDLAGARCEDRLCGFRFPLTLL